MKKLNKAKVFGKYDFWYREDDKFVGQRIALGKYEPYLTKLMLGKINKNDVILDIGANIGYYTVLMADKVKKVIAIEPDPTNFEILQKNIKENKLKNVVAVQAALGNENKKMGIYESKENYGDHRMWGKGKENLTVFCRRLDDLLKELQEEKVDFIKMDVQGFEAEVIKGGEKMFLENKPTMFFEYWPWGIEKAESDYKKMMEFLRNIYGKVFSIDEYIQIYSPVSQKFLDEKYKNEDEYGNLWVKNKINFSDRFGQIKDFWVKKFVKRMLGKQET